MMRRAYPVILPVFLFALSAQASEKDLQALMQKVDMQILMKNRSESVLLDESIAVEQARVQAQRPSEFGMELRPRVTDEEEAGVALRVYLPDRWNKSNLREQLALVAESEQLRVAALEWSEILQVYRLFCDYRMLSKQIALFDEEVRYLKPYLNKANQEVELNQLAVTDRAKLFSQYLDLINDQERIKNDLIEVEKGLLLLLGVDANLAQMSNVTTVTMPPEQEFNKLLQQAMKTRTDFRWFDVQARALRAAEEIAQSEDAFRLRYIQPEYDVDYKAGESTISLSASFVLPWGRRNSEAMVYRRQRDLNFSAMVLQWTILEHRLRVMLKTASVYYDQSLDWNTEKEPLVRQLKEDLQTMDTGRMEDLRDLMLIRERILNTSLQTARTMNRKERLAVDLAEELGSL